MGRDKIASVVQAFADLITVARPLPAAAHGVAQGLVC
jgi:hypothetical protein